MKVLIAGGSGLIGKKFIELLQREKIEINLLSRTIQKIKGVNSFLWNTDNGEIDLAAFHGIDAIVNFSGAGIADEKWTNERKKIILESRVRAVDLLKKGIIESGSKVGVFIGASATGFYGAVTSEEIVEESHPDGKDYLGSVCKKWENAYSEIENLGIRTCTVRIGIVLSKEGGAFPKMKMPVKLGMGSALGSGKQWMPWIHIEDICGIFYHLLLRSEARGVFNAVSGHPVTNHSFMKQLAEVMNKPFFLPAVPTFLIKLLFGEMACIVLEGTRVSNKKTLEEGYMFAYPDLKSALENLI